MPLQAAEIQPGAIAYFDVEVLHSNPAVDITGARVQRQVTGNQFVCYKVDGAVSYWSPLTASFKKERTLIKAEWVSHGYGPLGAGQVWLQDGANTYRGPHTAFEAASHTEHGFVVARPAVSATGLQAVHKAIKARGGAL
jgi:hypothetical protein